MKKEIEEVVLEGTVVSDQVARNVVEYSTNNSGGSWWLDDEDWHKLELAGWKVEWKNERWLGALATRAYREGLSYDEAVAEWESITGEDANDSGCDCCGQPHYFSEN